MTVAFENLGPKAFELKIDGTVRKQDYEQFRPHIDARIREYGKTNLLVHVTDMKGFTPAALWEDLKFDVAHFNDVNRLAVVGKSDSQQWMAKISKPFTAATVEYFPEGEIETARRWIREEKPPIH